MSVTIRENQVFLPNTDYVDWSGEALAPGKDGKINFGNIEVAKVLDDGKLSVKTNLGTLTFKSGPLLEKAKQEFSAHDFLSTGEKISSLKNDFNFLELMQLLFKTNKDRKEMERGLRHAARDSAMQQSLTAAQEIRSGALANLVLGIVSSGINILGGAISLRATFKSVGGLRRPAQDLKMAKLESKIAKTDTKLKQSQLEISETKIKLDSARRSDPKQVKELEGKLTTLQEQESQLRQTKQTQLSDLDHQIVKAEKQLKNADADLAKRTDAAKNSDSKVPQKIRDRQLKASQENHELAEAKLNDLNRIKAKATASEQGMQSTADSSKLPEMETRVAVARDWVAETDMRVQKANDGLSSSIQAGAARSQAVSSIAQGASQLAGGVGQFAEQLGQASAKEFDARAELARSAADDAKEDMQSAHEVIADVIKFFDAIRQSQADVARSIARGY